MKKTADPAMTGQDLGPSPITDDDGRPDGFRHQALVSGPGNAGKKEKTRIA